MNHKGNTLGVFHRAFPVELPDEPIRFMTAEVKNVADIDRLKYQKWLSKSESSVLTLGGQAFGYGIGMEKFADEGFSETQVVLKDSPALAEGLIIEGLIDDARTRGRHYFGIYRNCCKMVRDEIYAANNGYIVKIGYDIMAVHWTPASDSGGFGLLIEPAWTISRENTRRGPARAQTPEMEATLMSMHGILTAEDYVNAFVDAHREFLLPCGGKALVSDQPITIFTNLQEES